MNEPTCGQLYRELLGELTDMSPEQVKLFANGWVAGQAEKVYLRACQAAMFRPSPEHLGDVTRAACMAARVYGLRVWQVVTDHPEIWLHDGRTQTADMLYRMDGLLLAGDQNSRQWHHIRATLCGLPPYEIDEQYHLREGHGEPCDRQSGKGELVSWTCTMYLRGSHLARGRS